MTKSIPFAVLAAASLLSGAAAFAAQVPAKKTVSTRAVSKTTTGTPRTVTAKLANGKSVTYDCSKPGNATKKACKV